MHLLDFRALVRSVLGPGVAMDCEARRLSYQYGLAAPVQQAACVQEVLMDWSRKMQAAQAAESE